MVQHWGKPRFFYPMTSQLIAAKNLSRIYKTDAGDVVGITHINLSIAGGEFLVLKGESGSGKSTLLSLLAGLDKPTSGELLVSDYDLRKSSSAQLTRFRRKVVGMVFQNFNLLPTLTVQENVALPGLLAGVKYTVVQKKTFELLDWLSMADRMGHFPSQLSGGEMQRTAIARALINDPMIILADEPTGSLDSQNGDRVMGLLEEIHQKNHRTIIIATHSEVADNLATRQIHLKDGFLVSRT